MINIALADEWALTPDNSQLDGVQDTTAQDPSNEGAFTPDNSQLKGVQKTTAWSIDNKRRSSSIRLENDNLALLFDHDQCSVIAIENKLTGENHDIYDMGFSIEVGKDKDPGSLGAFTPENCQLDDVQNTASSVEYTYSKDLFKIVVSYQLEERYSFATKHITLSYRGQGLFNVRRLDILDFDLSPKPQKAMPYYGFSGGTGWYKVDDNEPKPTSDNSTAFFYRDIEGGLFSTVTCDYVLMQDDVETGRYRSTYWPGLILNSSQPFQSEDAAIGVYRRKGYFHPPAQPSDVVMSHFFSPNLTRLDRSEIDAVMEVVNHYISPGVYKVYMNGYTIGLLGDPEIPGPAVEIQTLEDLERFKECLDLSISENGFEEFEMFHFVHSLAGLGLEFSVLGHNAVPAPNIFMDEFIRYAGSKGLDVSMFVFTSLGWPPPEDPSLYTLNKEGKRDTVENNGNSKQRIAITKAYTNFIYDTFNGMQERYQNMGAVSIDFMFIQPDYDSHHGYLPGRASLYPQYKNVIDMLAKFRQRYPDLMFRGMYGWNWLGPWLSNHFTFVHNSADPGVTRLRNFPDLRASYQYANNLRLTNWYTNNCKMFPRHKMNSYVVHNGIDYKAWDYLAWEYCVLSRIAVGWGFGFITNLPDAANGEVLPPETKAFLSKWVKWQKARTDYYLQETELFGEPRADGLDGYAYGNGEDSIVFICNPTYETLTAAVPVNSDIHLPAGKPYTVKELYPEERYRIGHRKGLYDLDSTFMVDVPPQTVMVFEVKPDDPKKTLLLGIEGEIAKTAGNTLEINSIRGPAEQKRLFAVRPGSDMSASKVYLDGKLVDLNSNDSLLLGSLQFDGEKVSPEVTEWNAIIDGDKFRLEADIDAPLAAQELLQQHKQRFPVSKVYHTEKWLRKTAWLDSSRFIIYLPFYPKDWEIDILNGEKIEKALEQFKVNARLNGKPIEVLSNVMRGHPELTRWAGFFIDATDQIEYGKINKLELESPAVPRENFRGIYLANLTRSYSTQYQVIDGVRALTQETVSDYQKAFLPKPNIQKKDSDYQLYLDLAITSENRASLQPNDITVKNASIKEMRITGTEPRWKYSNESNQNSQVHIDSKPIHVRMHVEVGSDSIITLPFNRGTVTINPVEALEKWRQTNDPYQIRAGVYKPDNSKGVTVTLNLIDSIKPESRVKVDI